jgi:hypothetical protein
MKVLQTLVSKYGYRDWRGTTERLKIVATLLGEAAQRGCGHVILPAGFLQARRSDDVVVLRDAIVSLVQQRVGVGVMLGIDERRVTKATLDHLVQRKRLLPFWGVVVEPGGARVHMWQQQSFQSRHGTQENAVAIPDRTVDVHGKKVLALLCGEMFNRHLRAGLAGRGLDLIVDAGHDGLGTGLIPTLRSLARSAGCPALYSQHVGSTSRGLHMVLADLDLSQASISASNHVLLSGPRIPWVSVVEREI